MQPYSRLSNDPVTGDMLIDGVPATPEQVRKILHEDGYWYEGEYATYEIKPRRDCHVCNGVECPAFGCELI